MEDAKSKSMAGVLAIHRRRLEEWRALKAHPHASNARFDPEIQQLYALAISTAEALSVAEEHIEKLEAKEEALKSWTSGASTETIIKRIDKLEKEVTIPKRTAPPLWPGGFTENDVVGRAVFVAKDRKIVCLCGSTRFGQAFREANLSETLKGNIVLTVGSMMHSDDDVKACVKCRAIESATDRFCGYNPPDGSTQHRLLPLTDLAHAETKKALDALHKDKITMADEVLVLNVKRCVYCRYDETNVPMPENECRGHEPHVGQPLRTDHHWRPYIGESTRSEVAHALKLGKRVRFLNPQGPNDIAAIKEREEGRDQEDIDILMQDIGLRVM